MVVGNLVVVDLAAGAGGNLPSADKHFINILVFLKIVGFF
jgi:hypothetical protein